MKNIVFSLVMAVGVAGIASSALAQKQTWDLANEYPPNSVHAQSADRFIEALREASGGDIEITAHHGSALGYKSLDQFDAVGDGAIEVASSFVGPWAGIDPIFLLPSLPF
ncbi:MAG: C4-dicarboxylate ABC transporter substrate-binding protein, partial [Pseudomonadota bacterium]|nr:C4-dicarboxylate ABC transporter substrate-binding protein [Pseudomonadota bacterium]